VGGREGAEEILEGMVREMGSIEMLAVARLQGCKRTLQGYERQGD